MKINILTNGFIASHFKYDKIVDRLNPTANSINGMMDRYKPDVLVNCLGYCGKKNIDDCELEKEKTYNSNVTIPLLLAEYCDKHSIKFIQLSSGCVYYGYKDNGWKEDDLTSPLSFYSKTKYSADLLLQSFKDVLCLRLRMPISSINNPRNLINKIKKYEKLIDMPNSVTFVDDLVKATDFLIKKDKRGIYNVASDVPLSAADVMKEYQKYDKNHLFEIISEVQLNELVTTPRSNCILNTDKLKSEGFIMSPSEETLKNCMKKYFEGNV